MTNGNTETMEYNGLNQLVKKLDNGGSTGKTTYQYDGSGNQTGVSVSSPLVTYTDTLTYDPYNRLTATNRTYPNNSKVLLQKNTYNGDGKRVASTFTSGGNTTTEYYHYTEGQLSYVKDVADVTTGKYIYNDEGGVLLREEKATSGTGKSYISYTKDIRGSAKTLISQIGKKLVSYDYNDYGETIVRTAADNTSKVGYGNHLCYTGGVYDKATGMYYLNARYYDPSVAGFITQDKYVKLLLVYATVNYNESMKSMILLFVCKFPTRKIDSKFNAIYFYNDRGVLNEEVSEKYYNMYNDLSGNYSIVGIYVSSIYIY